MDPKEPQTASRYRPKPPLERRARRAEVERRLIRGERFMVIVAEVGAQFGVNPWTIAQDVRVLRTELDKGDPSRPERFVRRLEALSRKAEDDKDYALASECVTRAGRMLGLGTGSNVVNIGPTLNVSGPVQVNVLDGGTLTEALSMLALEKKASPLQMANGNGQANGSAS